MHFATSAASFVLVIGRRFFLKSVVWIYDEREIDNGQTMKWVSPLIARANIQWAISGIN